MTGDPFREFDGYVNKQATEKKTARDVFRKGDMAFLTGNTFVLSTVEVQWLEYLWNHKNMFETGVVRAYEC